MDYKKIDTHMKMKFNSNNKIKEIANLTDGKIDQISDNEIYKAGFSAVAIDIIDSVKLNTSLNVDIYNKIISEFVFGVSSIMKEYQGLWLTIQGDMVYAIFESKDKSQIDGVFNVACELHVFMTHLNKNINKTFRINNVIKAGIGVWFSFDNYITKVGKSSNRDIVFMGDAVNKACKLANLAGRNNYRNILFNDLINTNFTDGTKIKHNKIGSFNTYSISGLNGQIYGCDWIMTGYDNFVKNNV
ncbi:MAG: hypothetical protein KFW07_00680 [Mycoplasmataceae bacterium]|nr:hypothetical protein [Mycoplasmataceae bacterium]